MSVMPTIIVAQFSNPLNIYHLYNIYIYICYHLLYMCTDPAAAPLGRAYIVYNARVIRLQPIVVAGPRFYFLPLLRIVAHTYLPAVSLADLFRISKPPPHALPSHTSDPAYTSRLIIHARRYIIL